jgi:hypothetical protein
VPKRRRRLAAPQARSVEVEEQGIHLAQRPGLNKEQFDELYALAPKYAAKYDEELRKRAADFEKAGACLDPLSVLSVFMIGNIFTVEGENFVPTRARSRGQGRVCGGHPGVCRL